VVLLPGVLAVRPRRVSLEKRLAERVGRQADDVSPVPLRADHVRGIVDMHGKAEAVRVYAEQVQPAEEQPNHVWIAIGKPQSFERVPGFGLGPLRPVRDNTHEQQLAVGQRPDAPGGVKLPI